MNGLGIRNYLKETHPSVLFSFQYSNFSDDFLLWILFALGLLSVYAEFTVAGTNFDTYFYWPFYLFFLYVQRIPAIVLTVLIIKNPNISEGKIRASNLFSYLHSFFKVMN